MHLLHAAVSELAGAGGLGSQHRGDHLQVELAEAGMNYNEGFSSGDRKATSNVEAGQIDRLEYTTHAKERKIDSCFRVDSS